MGRRGALAAAIVMAMALTVVAVPTAGAQNYYGKQLSLAFADWLTPTERPDHFDWAGAFVLNRTDAQTGKERRYGGLLRGRCILKHRVEGSAMMCAGMGIGLDNNDVFEMEVGGRGARLVATKPKREHRVTWEPTNDPPGLYESYEECANGGDTGQGQGAGFYQRATAKGEVFGRRVATDPESDWEWTALLWGASVTECDFARDLLDGGPISLTKQLPPRG